MNERWNNEVWGCGTIFKPTFNFIKYIQQGGGQGLAFYAE